MTDYVSSADGRTIARQTAGLVVPELGEGWTVDTSDTWAEYRGTYIDGPDGARLFLSLSWRDSSRLVIDGNYPREAHDVTYPRLEQVEITVSRDRGPAVIAREITRRLLPKYLEELTRARAAIARNDDYNARTLATAEKIAAEIPGATVSQDKNGTQVSLPYRSGGYGAMRVSSDSVSIDRMSLPTETAIAVARAIGASL